AKLWDPINGSDYFVKEDLEITDLANERQAPTVHTPTKRRTAVVVASQRTENATWLFNKEGYINIDVHGHLVVPLKSNLWTNREYTALRYMPVGTTSKPLRYSFLRKKFRNRWVYLAVLSLRLQMKGFSSIQSMIMSDTVNGSSTLHWTTLLAEGSWSILGIGCSARRLCTISPPENVTATSSVYVTHSVQTNQVAKADISSHHSRPFRMDSRSSAGMAKQEIEAVSKLNLQHD
ncbi:hypothetical protein V2W45_1255870, partial [Cenococcum geophilum]